MSGSPNKRAALGAGRMLCLHVGRDWPGAAALVVRRFSTSGGCRVLELEDLDDLACGAKSDTLWI
jgi:hypothetical protein